jgi:predicted N-formylglutamate amidohydrolase
MARRLGAPLYVSAITRLLVEINRSPGHPHLFSEFSAGLDRAGRARVLEEYYEPHRRRVEAAVRSTIEKRGSVVHVGVHSFVPRLGRVARNADIGLLYDPGRARERDLCWRWRDGLRESSGLRVRLNYPYRGNADGFTTWLRRRLPARRYAGIELEINQACLVDVDARARARLLRLVADGLAAASS